MSETGDVPALQARIRELETELERRPPAPSAPEHRPGRARSVLAAVMVVLACVLAPLSVASVWADRIMSDTDQYVKTVAPLAEDPGVQAALSAEVSDAVLDNVDVQTIVHEALGVLAQQRDLRPAVAAALPGVEGALVAGIDGFVRDQVARFIASDQFARLWDEANRLAHTQVVRLLSGSDSGLVTTEGDAVTLNLAPVIDQVKEALVDKGFTLAGSIPSVDRSFVLMDSSSITRAQSGYHALDVLGLWLPVVAIALLAGGVLLARDRRRALLRASLGLAAAMVMLGLGLAVMRTWYVETTPGNVLSSATAGDVFDVLVRFLRTSLRAVGVLALVLAVAAWVSGPSPASLRTRQGFSRGIGSLRGSAEAAGWQAGRVGTWTYAHRRALRWAVAVAGGAVLVFWSQPTAWVVLGIALVVGFLLAVIAFLGRPPRLRA